jgi:Cu2+-exporting ATPase
LDKTGTLTKAELEIIESVFVGELEPSSSLALACALESVSEHPIAKAFLHAADTVSLLEVKDRSATPNRGVEGQWEGRRVRVGQPSYVSELWQEECLQPPEQVLSKGREALWILLGDENGPLAWFALEDQLRPEAKAFVHELKARGLEVELLSGDPSPALQRVARELNIETARGGLTPKEKLDRVRALEAEGAVVVMVGDGVNDAPVLAAAQVSIAMGGGADLAKITADAVLLGDDLSLLTDGLRWARQTRRVIRQNVTWALAYNLCALPLAALGWVPPWLAALGMSASSLLVTVNALRLHRVREKT